MIRQNTSSKKTLKPCDKRRIIEEITRERPRDISNACRLIRVSKSSLAYQSVKDDSTLERKLRQLAQDFPREGFWKSYYRLRNAGESVNHKRLHRVYKNLGLPLRRKVKRRVPARQKETLDVLTEFNHT